MEMKGGCRALVRIELAESRDLEGRLRLTCWAFVQFSGLLAGLRETLDRLRTCYEVRGDINEARRRCHSCLRLQVDQYLSRLGCTLVVLLSNTCTRLSARLLYCNKSLLTLFQVPERGTPNWSISPTHVSENTKPSCDAAMES